MLTQIRRLSRIMQVELEMQAENILQDWNEPGSIQVEWNGQYHQAQCSNDDETILVLYRCTCGRYIADQEEVSELSECECGRNYLI